MSKSLFSILEKYKNNREMYVTKLSEYVSTELKKRLDVLLQTEYKKIIPSIPYYTFTSYDMEGNPSLPDLSDVEDSIIITKDEVTALENNIIIPSYTLWMRDINIGTLKDKDYIYSKLSAITDLHKLYAYKSTTNIISLTELGSISLDKIVELLKYEYAKTIQDVADTKHDYVNTYIAGKPVSRNQVTVYKDKYELAVLCKDNGDNSIFDLEAEFTNVDTDVLVDSIIEKGGAWRDANNMFLSLIEAARIRAIDIIYSLEVYDDVIYVEDIIKRLNNLRITATADDIRKVFTR